MPGARFDPGSRRGRGGALPGKPRRMLGGDAVTQPGFQSLPENAGPGAPVAFGGSHVIPSCPVPLPEHSPFPREFPCGALCTCSPVGVEESRELPADQPRPFPWRLGEGDGFGMWEEDSMALTDTPSFPRAGEGGQPRAEEIYTRLTIPGPGDGAPQPRPCSPLWGWFSPASPLPPWQQQQQSGPFSPSSCPSTEGRCG